jgi:ribosome-associated protein
MGKPPSPPPEPNDDAVELRSRTDGRRAQKLREDALEQLADDLTRINRAQLAQLELDEELLDAIELAQSIKSPPGRQRQIRAVRTTLRDTDWWALRSALDHLREHGTVAARTSEDGVETAWVVRLLGEGGVAIDELLAAHPNADRSRLRTLIRNTQKAGADRRKKAEKELARAVREILAG